jgi:hypothetical protein
VPKDFALRDKREMGTTRRALLGLVPVLLAGLALSTCAPPEDPARAELRARLKQSDSLSSEELGRVLDETGRTLDGKTIRIKLDGAVQDLVEPQREAVLGILTHRAGVFDEGVRMTDGATLRVINAPGRASNAELDAARRLLIDVETLLPRRFEFSSGVAADEYAFDLVIDP